MLIGPVALHLKLYTVYPPPSALSRASTRIPHIESRSNVHYNTDLWNQTDTVVFIRSIDYILAKNNPEKLSFAPLKKISAGSANTNIIQCYNGSTCTESKLLGYLYMTLGKKFKDVDGMVAIWIGNDLPPNHTLPDYCYESAITKPNQLQKLEELTDKCIQILLEGQPNNLLIHTLAGGTGDIHENTYSHFRSVMRNVVQQLCLPCPGCVANYNAFTTGKMELWDHTGCPPPPAPSHAEVAAGRLRRVSARPNAAAAEAPVSALAAAAAPVSAAEAPVSALAAAVVPVSASAAAVAPASALAAAAAPASALAAEAPKNAAASAAALESIKPVIGGKHRKTYKRKHKNKRKTKRIRKSKRAKYTRYR